MSGNQDSDAEKSHEPTQRRLDEMRKDGDIPRSAELLGAASLLGFALVFIMAGGSLVQRLGDLGMTFLGQPDRLVPNRMIGFGRITGSALGTLALPILAVFALPMILVLATAFAQRSMHFTPKRIKPKWSRISPISGVKNRFGREGLVAFLRNILKATAVFLALGYILGPAVPDLVSRFDIGAGPAGLWLGQLMLRLLTAAAAMALVFGGADFLWQWWLHRQRARMSHDEVKSEMKDQEGNPELKAHRRQRGMEIAMNKMLGEVKNADVVVVNPTHYAVALKWKRSDPRPPLVVAKGVDDIAARIRERAAEAGVPIYSDPPTARALHATVEVGQIIKPDHYKAVAAAIRFAETIRRRARGMNRGR